MMAIERPGLGALVRPGAPGYIDRAADRKNSEGAAISSHDDIVSFGCFELDRKRCLLFCDGRPVAIGLKQIDVLACLIDGRADSMSKRDIIACAWRGQVVSDGNLSQQIFNLRQALTPLGGEGLIITTHNGYRFVGEVTVGPRAPVEVAVVAESLVPAGREPMPTPVLSIASAGGVGAARPPRGRRPPALVVGCMLTLVALLAVAFVGPWISSAPALPRLSIAVLPFRDRSDGGTHAPLADAITDDLTTDLAHIPGSVVVARASVEALGEAPAGAAEVGHRLKVRYLLTGSIRAEDAIYRINADLVEAATGQQIWSERFDTPMGGLADTQTTIVRHIASALDARMIDYVSAQVQHDRPNDPTAQDLFFRGRAAFERNDTLAGFTTAQKLLEQAVSLQPQYVDALAELGLALVLKTRVASDPTPRTDLDRARQVVAQALQLSQTNPTALAADARLHETEGDCMQATQSADAALALEPNGYDALAVLAKCSEAEGRLDDAAAYDLTLLRLNPDSGRVKPRYLVLSQIRLLQGRYEEAVDLAYRALAGEAPPASGVDCMGRAEYARLILIAALQLGGHSAQAKALYASYTQLWPHRTVWRVAAYSPQRLAGSKGFLRFLSGLADAGMPRFADEHADDHVDAASLAVAGDDFSPTPLHWRGATTVDTPTLAATLAAGQAMVVLDLGQGAATIPGSAWLDRSATDAPEDVWIDNALAGHPNRDLLQTVVVMSTGTYGQQALRAAVYLLSKGYRNVFWYRGGEEAWAAAGLQSVDRRLLD